MPGRVPVTTRRALLLNRNDAAQLVVGFRDDGWWSARGTSDERFSGSNARGASSRGLCLWTREPRRGIACACRRAARCPAGDAVRRTSEPSIRESKSGKARPVTCQVGAPASSLHASRIMIRVEVIPPEFDLSRPVKRRESAAASSSIDIFTGKNQRLKSRYRRVDPRSIVGQRGSGDTNETDFRTRRMAGTQSLFSREVRVSSEPRLGNAVTEHRRVHVRGNLYYTVASGAPRAQPTPRFGHSNVGSRGGPRNRSHDGRRGAGAGGDAAVARATGRARVGLGASRYLQTGGA